MRRAWRTGGPGCDHEGRGCCRSVPGVIRACARWTGLTLRMEIEGWAGPDVSARDADAMGSRMADEIFRQFSEAGTLTMTT